MTIIYIIANLMVQGQFPLNKIIPIKRIEYPPEISLLPIIILSNKITYSSNRYCSLCI